MTHDPCTQEAKIDAIHDAIVGDAVDSQKPGILRRLDRMERIVNSIVWGLALVATASITGLIQAFTGAAR